MRQGTFFLIEPDLSLQDGPVCFRYLPVSSITEEGKTIYPIYFIIRRFSIEFYYHSIDWRDYENEGEDEFLMHRNVCILRLPLSLNLAVKDNLTQILKRYYNGVYQLEGRDTLDLNKTITYYWNLADFFSIENYQKIVRSHFPFKERKELKNFVFYRKLILDFLYDLEHSRVFENSPFYEEAEVHLKENPFFNAIAAKASYYYYRKLYIENRADEKVKDLYSHKLQAANQQWLNIIRMKRSCKDFWNSGGWFKKVEDEYKRALFYKEDGFNYFKWQQRFNRKHKELSPESRNELKENSRWLLKRYNILNAFKTILFSRQDYKSFLIMVGLICLFFVPIAMLDAANGMKGVPKLDYASAVAFFIYFLIGIVIFWMIFAALYWELLQSTVGLLMPRLIMALSSAWFLFVTTEELLKVSFDLILFEHWMSLLLLLIPVVIFMSLEIKNLAPDISIIKISKRVLGILALAFFYSLFLGIFFTNLTAERILTRSGYLEVYFKEENSLGDKSNIVIPDEVQKKINDSIKNEHIIRQDELYKNLIDTRNKKTTMRFMYDVPFLFLAKRIRVFPGMLFYRTIFVLFIGIFIQLIFEEKAVTEPM